MILAAAALALTIHDGDTLTLNGQRTRLYAIDAPESRQLCRDAAGDEFSCGTAATEHLKELIAGRDVHCDQSAVPLSGRVDRYHRQIAVCYASSDPISLNQHMVADGYAMAYRHYSKALVPAETTARRERRGLWAGKFGKPWVWRHAKVINRASVRNTHRHN